VTGIAKSPLSMTRPRASLMKLLAKRALSRENAGTSSRSVSSPQGAIFRTVPTNVFLIKATYWIGR